MKRAWFAFRQAIPAVLMVLAACASRGATMPPAGAESPDPRPAEPHHHESALPATAGPGFTVADVRFMQDMIGHHAQAITMAALAPTHGAGSQLLKLAQKIDISQRDEIVMMEQWLIERRQAVPDSVQRHTMHMPGMLTPDQLAQLDAARGRDFDRLFLTFMIQHHRGALQMVDALFASAGAAQDSDIFRFVTDVATDQTDEIDVMTHMLETMVANRGSEIR